MSSIPEFPPFKLVPVGYSRNALFRAIIVIKAEKLSQTSDLIDYLRNNLIIAYLCGFDITKKLPSYWIFEHFIEDFGLISGKSISMDSTSIKTNTKFNNPKSFSKNKFSKNNQPKFDKDC